ncbi:C40 family peptidase [Allonocardiopsis opalescens]|uniref:Cell wall-associated NlpC family hydrolase n=1 Tax=Allonocardiopsis opalescens TaxID=1144618 RepID=A0A2T0Q9N6_9ACTN|nr:C40 family peptidase [Allonocardiopsis opalescens]PRY00522.1 cell wall-associated NlpC family hydrolase [Allonocardiopsis opalescens]
MPDRREWSVRGRIAAGVGLAAVGALSVPAGAVHADPEPTQEEVEQRIEELAEESSTLVQEFNEAEEDVEAAEAELEDVEEQTAEAEERYGDLRESLGELAAAAYRSGDLGSPITVLSAGDPQDVVEQANLLEYLSSSRQAELDEYTAATEHLEELRAEAEAALEEAEEARAEAESRAAEVEESLAEQEELLAEFEVSAVGEGSTSGSYTGSASGSAAVALDFAYAQLGKPYIWGGTGPDGYDCSGLTQAAWGAAGVSLPRTTYTQWEVGQAVAWDDMQPGDLMFFYADLGHMGMYVGNGQMIHAPSSGNYISVVTLDSYYQSNFQGARRP